MVREHIIHTTDVNIQGFPKQSDGHSRAFEMPAGASRSKRTFPEDSAVAGRVIFLPQDKICNVSFFVFVMGYSFRSSRPEFIQMEMGKASIPWKLIDCIIDTAVSS